jgi:hypothetical protein
MSEDSFGSGRVLERGQAVLSFATVARPAEGRPSLDAATPSPVERPVDRAELPVIKKIVRPTAVERAPFKSAATWVGGGVAIVMALAAAASAVHRSVADSAAARTAAARAPKATDSPLVHARPPVRIEAPNGARIGPPPTSKR